MKQIKLWHIVILVLLLVTGLLIFLVSVSKNSYDDDCQFKKFPLFNSASHKTSILNFIPSNTTSKLSETFRYNEYLKSDNWKDINSIRKDLIILDSINKDQFENLSVISVALTNKMNTWNTGNLDSLNLLLNWTEKFNTKSSFSDKYDLLYESTFNYWISFLSGKLDSLNQSNYSIKFNCKFNYLRMRCCQLAGACGDRDNNTTKAIRHIIDQDWWYLLKRFWIGTSLLFKLALGCLAIITMYGYICVIQKIVKKLKKR